VPITFGKAKCKRISLVRNSSDENRKEFCKRKVQKGEKFLEEKFARCNKSQSDLLPAT
jgi:hypothetical protein